MWHHLAADLRKSAFASGEGDEALGVELRDVAGAIPAVLYDLRREVGPVEIALHHVGAGDPEQAFLADGQFAARVTIGDFRARPEDRPTDGALAGVHRSPRHVPCQGHVGRHERRQFRGSVGFVRPQPKLFFKPVAHVLRELLGRPKHHFECRKILGRRPPDVDPQERRRGHQDRGMVLAGQPAHRLPVAGVGVVDDGRVERERRPERGRVAIRMEEGQHTERHVGRGEMEQIIDRPDVRADVLLGEHDALRIAGRARRENHREHVVGVDRVEPQDLFEHRQWGDHRVHGRCELVEHGELSPEPAGVKHPRAEIELHAGEKRRARNHVPQPGSLDACVEDRLARRVVEIHGHAAHQGERRIDDRRARRRRQHHTHHPLVGREHPFEHAPRGKHTDQEFAAREPRAE